MLKKNCIKIIDLTVDWVGNLIMKWPNNIYPTQRRVLQIELLINEVYKKLKIYIYVRKIWNITTQVIFVECLRYKRRICSMLWF